MSEHKTQDLDRLKAIAQSRFGAGLMSDTKWRKVIDLLGNSPFSDIEATVKWIDDDTPTNATPVSAWSLHPPHPWVEIQGQPVELRAIEWLELHVPVEQLDTLEQGLSTLGRLDIERSGHGLKILGYRAKSPLKGPHP